MWTDQRDRNSKQGWIWGSILLHVAIIGYFVLSPSTEHSAISSAANSETVTMTIAENKAPEAKISDKVEEAAPVAIAPVKKAEKKKSQKKVAPVIVKSLPKKEVQQEEQLDSQIEEQTTAGVVIPEDSASDIQQEEPVREEIAAAAVATETQQAEEQAVEDKKPLKEEPLVAVEPATESAKEAPKQEQKETGEGQSTKNENQAVGEKSAMRSETTTGTSNNPRSYLDLKQKPGNIPPRYPELARRQGIQGQTELKYFVNENGSVSNIQLVKSSGSAALDKEAIDAIKKYQYYPGQQGWAAHPVSFNLKGPNQEAPARLRTARGA